MSKGVNAMTDYSPLQDITFEELFSGVLAPSGVREVKVDDPRDGERLLTDGDNFLVVHRHGGSVGFRRYSWCGAPGHILEVIAKAFNTDIASEYEPEYWGFETQEEMDAFFESVAAEHAAEFCEDLMHFLRGEPNDIRPGTIGMEWAEDAKKLLAANPELASPHRKKDLLAWVRGLVGLSDEEPGDEATVPHEDDLPHA
jgi:hypothetical protein